MVLPSNNPTNYPNHKQRLTVTQFFIQGLQHPFLTPSHIIILAGFGILIGQQVKASFSASLSTVITFTLAMLVGAWSQRYYPIHWNIEQALLIIAATTGMFIAFKLNLLRWMFVVIALFCGLLIGQDSAPVMIPGIKMIKVYSSLLGSVISASLFLVTVAIVAKLLNPLLKGIPLRVVGSWIFASALMVLALQFAPSS